MTTATINAITAAGVAALLAGIPQHASAATRERLLMQNAPGICDAVNPVSDTKLTRYSIGLRNISTSGVSIGCSMLGDENAAGPASQVFIYFKNHAASARSVSCTLATTPYWGVSYSTKTLVLPAGVDDFIDWAPGDYPSNDHSMVMNLTCTLPPGVSAREIATRYNEDVGA